MTEYERGLCDAFTAMMAVKGCIPQHIIAAMTTVGANFDIPEIESAKAEIAKLNRERADWRAALPPDYEARLST